MSAYGLRIYDADGNITLDAPDKICRLRYSVVAPALTDGSINLPDIAGHDSVQFGVALTSNWASHRVTRSGTTIIWQWRDYGDRGGDLVASNQSSDSLILVFLYS